ncbi:zinc knuckle CX2CX4HX4C containing protein [Tanacetum coccineum]
MEKGFLSLVERGRCVKEKDKRGTPAVNTRVMEVYVNEVGQATMNVIESTMNVDESGNGNNRVNVDATYTPNVEYPAPVMGDEGIKGSVLTENNKGISSYARVVIELRANVELKDTIVVVVPKLGEGFFMRTIRIEYEWKPPRCSSCKVFGHFLDDCPKNHLGCVKEY